MSPSIHFLGTGCREVRGELSEGGFLLRDSDTLLLVDPGPGAAFALRKLKVEKVDGCVVTDSQRGHDAGLIDGASHSFGRVGSIVSEGFDGGVRFRLPDGVVTYIFGKVRLSALKGVQSQVLVLFARGQEEEILRQLRPKLAILTGFNKADIKKGPMYFARDLQAKTGIQTIAAQDDFTVDLVSYGALAAQKGLDKFTAEK